MNYPTQLHEKLAAIEAELADSRLRRPAPFERLRSVQDRPPSNRRLHLHPKKDHTPLVVVTEFELPADYFPAPESVLGPQAVAGAETELTPYEPPLQQAS